MKKKVEVSLPIRINFGGAWSDTPPFCFNEGGCVCNSSAIINGKRPVKVAIEEIGEDKIVLQNENSSIDITDLNQLRKNENDEEFNLLKNTLILTNIKHKKFKIETDTSLIPRGSGLGTNSILILAILQAIYKYENIKITENELINQVLEVEKMIGTGGGWQDQGGAIRKGIKLLSSEPGKLQKLKIETINMKSKKELNNRFALIYTGKTRNSGNIVKEIMTEYQNSEEQKLRINKLKEIAIKMKEVLEIGNIEGFAELLNQNYEITKKLNGKIVNKTTERILKIIDNIIDGKMICGAGNGGFIEIILKKGRSKQELQNKLDKEFKNSNIKVWDVELE